MATEATQRALYGSPYRPTSKLAEYRRLSKLAGVRVSPICLGAMNFGKGWEDFVGPCSKEEALKIFDKFIEHGGNFIDTAVNYQCGDSETWLGEFMAQRGNREELVIATKYSGAYRPRDNAPGVVNINNEGNARKNLMQAVETSLKRLQTSYIDIYYIHYWNYACAPDEIMQTMDVLVRQGKILYPAISDAPAWVVAQCNTIAQLKNWSPFVLYQGHYSIGLRDMERDVMPMARDLGLSVIPWGVLGAGKYTGKYKRGGEKDADATRMGAVMSEKDYNIADKVEEIAKKHKAKMGQICIAWMLRQPNVNTILLGQRTVAQLEDNIAALDVVLDDDDMKALDAVSAIDLGFPHTFLGGTDWQSSRFTKSAPGKIVG
ncbi:norsolorinic acid reductase [Hyaloraphidium curvatum]|nr:norsolorinic acid reductase [Hyaloraphidium curvatum]